MSIYMKLGDVEGEVTTKRFEKQIEIMSASFGTARNIASPTRKANGRESSEPRLSEANLTSGSAGRRRRFCFVVVCGRPGDIQFEKR